MLDHIRRTEINIHLEPGQLDQIALEAERFFGPPPDVAATTPLT
jgi:hypothetical protein